MKYLRQAAALLLAAVIATGTVTAFAEDAVNKTVEEQVEQADNTEAPEQKPFDPSNIEYEPIDLTDYVRWDGTSDFEENTNYYIDSDVKIGKDSLFTLPESSRLVVCEGAELLAYVGGKLQVGGVMTVAPGASFASSGTFSVLEGGAFENFGDASFTLSSVVNISSKFVVRSGSEAVFSGAVNVYKSGEFITHGNTTVTQSSVPMVTGAWQVPETGRLFLRGKMTVTLSGRFFAAGYVSLSGELLSSGMAVFEENVRYYQTNSARLSVTKSGRVVDYRKTEESSEVSTFKSGAKGIDVSVWQGAIDWKRVKKAGVQFAIIRSSYSVDKVDKMFQYNITEAQKAGVMVGVYHYCYALTVEQAREEAKFFIETIKPYKIDYPVMFDFEDNSQVKLGKNKLTEIALAFMDEIEKAGYYGMIYSYKNWLTDNLDMNRLSKYEVALAQWDIASPTYTGSYGIWQYSCKGIVSGIQGDVDLDISYKDYAKIIREGGYNHLDEFES